LPSAALRSNIRRARAGRGKAEARRSDDELAWVPALKATAVKCAVEIQRDLAEANLALAEDRRMWFRIGINVGDVMVKNGDIFGDGVNIAVRLEGLAKPGGICISRGVHDHVRRKLPYGFEDLGEQSVKNIAPPIRVFRLIPDATKTKSASGPGVALVPSGMPDDLPSLAQPPPEPQSVELVFWESIKDSTHVADYEAYLRQYPEGSFIALAGNRLGEFASAGGGMRDPQDREVELSFWESVRESSNPASLHAYLDKYPDGEFKSLADIRLSELGAPPLILTPGLHAPPG